MHMRKAAVKTKSFAVYGQNEKKKCEKIASALNVRIRGKNPTNIRINKQTKNSSKQKLQLNRL